MRFDPDRLYRATDPELRQLGTQEALAQHRHRGQGPAYIKHGRFILYDGAKLNEYLDRCEVLPTDQAA